MKTLDMRVFFYSLVACQFVLALASIPLGSVTWDEPIHYKQVVEQLAFARDVLKNPASRPDFVDIFYNLEWYGSGALLPPYLLSLLSDALTPAPSAASQMLAFSASLHVLTIATGLACAFLAVAIVYQERRSRFHAYLAGSLLAATPIWMGSAYFNYKDIPIGAAFMICLYGFQRYYAQPSARNSIIFMLGMVFLGSQRLAAYGLAAPMLVGFALASLRLEGKAEWFKTIGAGVVALVGLYVLTPPAWVEPIRFMLENVQYMSAHGWPGCALTAGACVGGSDPAWSAGAYLAHWWGVQLPVGFVLLAAFAIPGATSLYFKRELASAILLMSWVWPLAALAIFNSLLYDGTRHTLFVLPLFLIWACAYAPARLESARLAIYAYCIFLMVDAAKLFPYQSAWLNEGARFFANETTHEMDYWGFSMNEARNLGMKTWPHLRVIDVSVDDLGPVLAGDDYRKREQIEPGTEYLHVSMVRKALFTIPEECADVVYVTRRALFAPAPIRYSYAARCVKP